MTSQKTFNIPTYSASGLSSFSQQSCKADTVATATNTALRADTPYSISLFQLTTYNLTTMRKLTLILSLILFLLPASAENKFEVMPIKKIEANPINVAVMLTEQLDSTSMASTCEYYGYINQPSQDDFTVFKHPNGSIIRIAFTTAEDGKLYPTVEVKSKGTKKDKEKKLESLNFKKNGNINERRSIGFITRCASTPQGFLRFSNHPKSKD